VEGVEAEWDHRRALLHRDHQRPRVQGPWVAEALPRALDVDADEVSGPDELARAPNGLAVALPAADAEDAEPAEDRAEHGNRHQLRLGQKVERPR
jgi:hypothetical protein